MKPGDIFWVELPVRGGHTQEGRRPVIVMQNENASSRLSTALVVPMTTQREALRFPGTVLIEKDEHNGLRRDSVALVFQMTTIDQRLLLDRLGAVDTAMLESLYLALSALF